MIDFPETVPFDARCATCGGPIGEARALAMVQIDEDDEPIEGAPFIWVHTECVRKSQ